MLALACLLSKPGSSTPPHSQVIDTPLIVLSLPHVIHARDTGPKTTAHTTVALTNLFSADLVVRHVTSHNDPLGSIDAAIVFTSKANSTADSPALDVVLNMDLKPFSLADMRSLRGTRHGTARRDRSTRQLQISGQR